MKNLNVDLFDPRSTMDSDFSPGVGASQRPTSDSDFAFAFNDSNFSDRVLRIEILPDLPDSKSDVDGYTTVADWARNRKRRREDIRKEDGSFNYMIICMIVRFFFRNVDFFFQLGFEFCEMGSVLYYLFFGFCKI